MNSLKDFIRSFIDNKGGYVFLSFFIGKLTAFLSSLFLIRLLSEEDFGIITKIVSIFVVFLAFNGMGAYQSLLRFGAIEKDKKNKDILTAYALRVGMLFQVLISLIFLIFNFFYIKDTETKWWLIIAFSVRLIGFYFYNIITIYYRIHFNNSTFAKINNVVNIFGLLSLIGLTYFFGLKGYVFSIALSPFLSLFWYKKEIVKRVTNITIGIREFWDYAIHTAGTMLLSDLLFSLDIILINFFLDEVAIANYKTTILLPANITFLAIVFIQTDYPKLAENYLNANYLKRYIANYYKIFIPLSGVILGVGYFFDDEILSLFFGQRYSHRSDHLFFILLLGFVGSMLLRNLFGNLNAAVGKVKYNTVISILTIIVLLMSGFILIPKYEIIGVGISMSMSLIFSGVLSFVYFWTYLKRININGGAE
ncbi:MAG: polysaccharide biosynthesis protein [Flavobacteriales bacterium]|nr:MAG: polysaccharide biosynthesis protein [Flavobacteriales bacterium]